MATAALAATAAGGDRVTAHDMAVAEEHQASPSILAHAGFKMEDGVLTYPAPARFQPQNLNRE